MFYSSLQTKTGTDAISVLEEKWKGVANKPDRLACASEVILDNTWSLKGDAGAANIIVHGFYVLKFASSTMKLRSGANVFSGVAGNFLFLQWLLGRNAADDQDIAQNTAETGVTTFRIPFTYRFDAEEYLVPVDEIDSLQMSRAGTGTTIQTITSDSCEVLVKGRYLSARPTPRYREWIEHNSAEVDIYLPAGRYHAIFIVNTKGANANLFDSGITMTSPNCEMLSVDGRVLNRRFSQAYGLTDMMYTAADDESATLEDVFQVLYCPDPYSCKFDSGIVGPVHIRVNSSDPTTNKVYALRCVD